MTYDEKALTSWDWYETALKSLVFFSSSGEGGRPSGLDRAWSYALRTSLLLTVMHREFPEGHIDLLDLGCANGHLAAVLNGNASAFESVRYVGVDARQACVVEARRRRLSQIEADFRCGDALRHMNAASPYHVVVCTQTPRYWHPRYFAEVLRAIRSKLVPGGIFFTSHSVPSRFDSSSWAGYVGDWPHGAFAEFVESFGFSPIGRVLLEPDDRRRDELAARFSERCGNQAFRFLPPIIQALIALPEYPAAALCSAYWFKLSGDSAS